MTLLQQDRGRFTNAPAPGQASPPRDAWVADATRLLPLYIAVFLIMLCGISAVNSTVDDPDLTMMTSILVLLGVVFSFCLRLLRVNPRMAGWVAALGATLFLLSHSSMDSFLSLIEAGDQGTAGSVAVGMLLEWGTVCFAFLLLSNELVLFAAVPSLALIGLMSSENPNSEMVTYFLVFVLSAVFAAAYAGFLSQLDERPVGPVAVAPAVRSFLSVAVAIVGLSLTLGSLFVLPLRLVGRSLIDSAVESVAVPGPSVLPAAPVTETETMTLSGETPNTSVREVMRIRAPAAFYWRDSVLDRLDGVSWECTQPLVRPQELGSQYETGFAFSPAVSGYNRYRRRKDVTQQVALEEPVQFLPMAADPEAVRAPYVKLRANRYGAILMDTSEGIPPGYQALSSVSIATPSDLRAAPHLHASLLRGLRPFLLLPTEQDLDGLRRVFTKAGQVIRGSATEYDSAERIVRYLKANETYTLDPPSVPAGEDPTAFFLFQSHAGYCEHFASAMVVMCRAVGIPARIARGYAPGSLDPKTGEYVVREMDGHAWAELFFPTYGWIEFDPTGGSVPRPFAFFSLRKLMDQIRNLFESREMIPSLLLLAFALAVAYVLKLELFDRWVRPWAAALRRPRTRAPGPAGDVTREYRRTVQALRRLGLRKRPSQTAREFQTMAARRIEEAIGSQSLNAPDFAPSRGASTAAPGASPDALSQLTDLFELACYSAQRVTADQAGTASQLAKTVRATAVHARMMARRLRP